MTGDIFGWRWNFKGVCGVLGFRSPTLDRVKEPAGISSCLVSVCGEDGV